MIQESLFVCEAIQRGSAAAVAVVDGGGGAAKAVPGGAAAVAVGEVFLLCASC